MPFDRGRIGETAAARDRAQHRTRIGAVADREQGFVYGQRLWILDEYSRRAGRAGTCPDRILPQIGPPDPGRILRELQHRVQLQVRPRDPVVEIRHQRGLRDHRQVFERHVGGRQAPVQVTIEVRIAARVSDQRVESMRCPRPYQVGRSKAREPQIGAVIQEAPGLGSQCSQVTHATGACLPAVGVRHRATLLGPGHRPASSALMRTHSRPRVCGPFRPPRVLG